MYLKQAIVANSGPLKRIDLDLAFTDEGAPKPLVLVGSNGGGKTNLLSLITDAIFEAAASHYQNVLPTKGMGRSWFRVVGGRTITVGAPGGYTLLRFEHAGTSIIYKEKAGTYDPAVAAQEVPRELAGGLNWPTEGAFKEFSVAEDTSRVIFEEGVHAYFPSSRSEVPFWLNRESIPDTEFEIFPAIAHALRKPIYVERSMHQFKQWLISVILESRSHIGFVAGPTPQLQLQGNVGETLLSADVLNLCNTVLKQVLDDDRVRFVWLGRKNPDKLAVARDNELILPNLDALSGGQSILLGLFGTLLRYADQSKSGSALDLAGIEGICVVDEIDSHIHVDLQHKVLPSLIRLFPKVQFIVSSHSPLFVLGMQRLFGDSGFQLVEMPAGNIVTAETYSEFGKAMEALTATEAFNQKLLEDTSTIGIPIVFVEGETDTPYLRRAAEVLGRNELLARCEIQWIGAKDDTGQGFHTGKAALDHTLAVLRANPKLTNRPVLLLYDNDAKKADADYGVVSVRSMPTNEANSKVMAGIENLLAEKSITEADYQVVESQKPNGDVHTRKTLRKAELCQRICDAGSAEDLQAFGSALDVIAAYLDVVAPLPTGTADGGTSAV
jgi:Predicted ATP-binding protein involved in virulence